MSIFRTNALLALGLWLAVAPAPAQTKRALLIAVGRYAPGTGWGPLSSDRDAALMAQALQRQGFSQPKILSNADATLRGIRSALGGLLRQAQPGDRLVVHYAGHGQQVLDRNGDEQRTARNARTDSLDEALVPYDAPRKADYARYRGERHLLDDEVGLWMDSLRRKVGPTGQVWLLLDCCHAGTGARAGAVRAVRGGAPPIAPAGFVAPADGDDAAGSAADLLPVGAPTAGAPLVATRGPAPAAFVLMAGSLASQVNHEVTDDEGQPCGALTYAVAGALARVRAGDTYQRLFDRVTDCLAEKQPDQTPALEGTASALVLGGDVVATPDLLDVVRESGAQLTRTVRLAAGWLTGLLTESRVNFIPAGRSRSDTAAVVARGRVRSAGPLESVVELDRPLSAAAVANLRAYETEKAFGETALRVGLGPGLPAEVAGSLKKTVSETGGLRLVDVPQASHLIRQEQSYLLLTETATFRTLDSLPVGHPEAAARLAGRLRDEYLARLVRGFSAEHPALRGTLRLLGPDSTEPPAMGYSAFRTGVPLRLRVTNTGSVPCYVAVLDVQPDGVVSPVLPNARRGYDQVYLLPGAHRDFALRLTPPYGTEVYKALFTAAFFDPGPVLLTRGDAPTNHPVLALLRQGFRGEPPAPVRADALGTATYAFRIVP
jgi:hypothetical protein